MVPILRRFLLINLNCKYYSSISLGGENAAKILYKHLMRQCNKLPEGPKQHYKFMVKQVQRYNFLNCITTNSDSCRVLSSTLTKPMLLEFNK